MHLLIRIGRRPFESSTWEMVPFDNTTNNKHNKTDGNINKLAV